MSNSSKKFKLTYSLLILLDVSIVSLVGIYLLNYLPYQTSQVTAEVISTTRSGSWSDPSVWNTGKVPATGDNVTIGAGTIVTYDVFSDVILTGVIINGTLKFPRTTNTTNTRLKTSENIVVQSGGYLDMGTAASPIPANIKAEIVFVLPQGKIFKGNNASGNPIDMANDTGLWVMEGGRWETHGAPLMRTWSKLSTDAPAGTSAVVVENDVKDWYVGGDVIITGTTLASNMGDESQRAEPQDETNTITSIQPQANGATKLLLTNPLQYTHSGTNFLPGNLGKGEVGLLTRNILITTDILGVDETTLQTSEDALQPGKSLDSKLRTFAHTVYMMGSTGKIQYTEFKYMGHFGALGRYPIHIHQMVDNSRGTVIRGNSITYSGHHAMNIHESNHLLVEDNVAYNLAGAGYFLEADVKEAENPIDLEPLGLINNIFIHNLGVGVIGYLDEPKMTIDNAKMASTFWTFPNTMELGDVAAGGTGYGAQGFQPHPNTVGGSPYVESSDVFVRNEAHGNKEHGLTTFSGNFSIPRDFVDMASWHNGGGFQWAAYTASWHLQKMKFVHNAIDQVRPTLDREYNIFDTLIASPGDATSNNQGVQITKYAPQNVPPTAPNTFMRNTFLKSKNDVSNFQDVCPPEDAAKEFMVQTADCPATYLELIGNQFSGILDFGKSMNANARWKVLDYQGPNAADLPNHFWLHRKDQALGSPTQTPLSAQVINSQTFYYAPFDALVTPITNPAIDYPPKVSLQMNKSGNLVTLTATPTDDKGVTRVEFFQDWKLIDADMTSPYQVTVNFSNPDTFSTKRLDDTFIQFEAESGTLSGATTKTTAPANEVYGGQYIAGGDGGTATYTINVPKTGRYRLWGRGFFPGTSGSGSYQILMDGKDDNIILGTNPGETTQVPGRWHWILAGYRFGVDPVDVGVGQVYKLTAGTHTLELSEGSGLRLDSLVLAWDDTVFPFESPDMNPEFGNRKYTYFYARAYDGTILAQRLYEQRGYSNIIELGPEVLLAP